MGSIKLMPDPIDLREVTFTNLLLLGFDPEANEAQYRIPFTRDMFAVPNRKAMEVVVYFLFTKLNHESTKETFRHCWPIVDKKKEQEFRKLTAEWLIRIKKDDPDSHLPNIAPSLLLSPTGDKFYQFLLYFSTYVLKQKMFSLSNKHGKIPFWPSVINANRKYLPQLQRGLTISSLNQKYRLITDLEEATLTKEKWMEFSKELSKEHRKLNKQKRDCVKQSKNLKETIERLFGKSVISSKESLKRTQKLQQTTELWKAISKLYESQKILEEEVQQIVERHNVKYSLDGKNIQVKIPDILLNECENQLQMGRHYENVYEEGKINLTSLSQLWNLSLHLIKETLLQYPLPNMEHDEAYIRAEAHNHASSLNTCTTIRHELSQQLLPELHLSTDELKEVISENQSTNQPVQNNTHGLDILPPTPPIVFETNTPSFLSIPTMSRDLKTINTPDAVNNLIHNVRHNVRHKTKVQENETPVRAVVADKSVSPSVKKSQHHGRRQRNTLQTTTSKHKQTSKIPVANNLQGSLPSVTFNESSKQSERKKQNFSTEDQIRNEVTNVAKAQEILIDQITQSVLNEEGFGTSRSSTDDDESNFKRNEEREDGEMHGLGNPLEAFNSDAFKSRDKVLRTPARKKRTGKSWLGPENENEMMVSKDGLEKTDSNVDNTEILKDTDFLDLQERIRKIKMRGFENSTAHESPVHSASNDVISSSSTEAVSQPHTPIQQIVSPFRDPNTPYHNVSLFSDPITSLNPCQRHSTELLNASITENTSPSSQLNTPTKEESFELTLNNVDKTNTGIRENIIDSLVQLNVSGNERTITPDINQYERLLCFTPSENVRPMEENSKMFQNFLENNKHLLDKTPVVQQRLFRSTFDTPKEKEKNLLEFTPQNHPIAQTPSSLMKSKLPLTPTQPTPANEIINYLTPFKDPFASFNGSSRYDVTTEDVDSFIEEVLSRTPGLLKTEPYLDDVTKTPRLFSAGTPGFSNDFSLLTPGLNKEKKDGFNFEMTGYISDDDEI